jgi:hypothetical protein
LPKFHGRYFLIPANLLLNRMSQYCVLNDEAEAVNRTRLILLLAVLLPANSHSAERVDFKGAPLGSSRQQLIEKVPQFACVDTVPADPVFVLGDTLCSIKANAAFTYGGIVPLAVDAALIRNSVMTFRIAMSPGETDDMVAAMTARYGAPAAQLKNVMKDKAGTPYVNVITTWRVADDSITISKYEGNGEVGSVFIQAKQAMAEFARRKAAAKRQTASTRSP